MVDCLDLCEPLQVIEVVVYKKMFLTNVDRMLQQEEGLGREECCEGGVVWGVQWRQRCTLVSVKK